MIDHNEQDCIWTGVRYGFVIGQIRTIGEFTPGDVVEDIYTKQRYVVGDTDHEGTLITCTDGGRQIYHYVIGASGMYESAPYYVETQQRINSTADRRYLLVTPAQPAAQPAQSHSGRTIRMKPIKHATSFATAHFIPDYPAGFTARVTKKMWVETKPGKGQRGVYATSAKGNPNKWCAPKANTYDELCGIAIIEDSDVVPGGKWTVDDVGHAIFVRVGGYGDVAFLERYNALFGPFETEYEASIHATTVGAGPR